MSGRAPVSGVPARATPIAPSAAAATPGTGAAGSTAQAIRQTRALVRDTNTNAYYANMPYGIGVVVQVTCAANTATTIPHKLNRVPNRIEVLDNGTGFTCGYARTSAWTTTDVYAQFPVALSGAWVAIL